MSAISIAHDYDPQTTSSISFVHNSESLHYTVTHVCLPAKLPIESDCTVGNDLSLARAICAAAHDYTKNVSGTSEFQGWDRVTRMLDKLQASLQSEHLDRNHIISQLRGMQTGDMLLFFVRHHYTAIILTKRESCTLLESFEVSPSGDVARDTAKTVICSYPGNAVEIPNELLDSGDLQFELANFLTRPDTVNSDLPLPPAHGQYMTTLLSGILRGAGRTVDVPHIVKRVRDDARPAKSTWRRSPVWLLIKVTIQMFLDRCSLGRNSYKSFMLFFLCTLARDANVPVLSIPLLHSIGSKIIRRLKKLGSSIPDWLSQPALTACTSLREILDARWAQLNTRPSSFRNPSQEELARDTELTLENSREYIRDALANHPHEPIDTAFHPSHRPRGTIHDFLSSDGSFFDEAYRAEPKVTLYDVQKSVEQGIDDWTAHVTNVEEACSQLEILMDKYIASMDRFSNDPEGNSMVFLTVIELFVALDKLVVQEIPMLADYSPEIPITWLEKLLFRSTMSLHRLACAYQYLSWRYSQQRLGWSVLSNELTKDSFPVRYYDQSVQHQRLKARIEEDAMAIIDGQPEFQEHGSVLRHTVMGIDISQLPLPTSPLQAKVVVFELQCPVCIRIWRSAVARLGHYACWFDIGCSEGESEDNLLSHDSALQHYFVDRDGPSLQVEFQFASVYSGALPSRQSPSLRYVARHPHYEYGSTLSVWPPENFERMEMDYFCYWLYVSDRSLWTYMTDTPHTSNDVLAAQANCPTDLSLDEFVAFGQLWSSGSLQWVDILRGLRSRTVNLRRDSFHSLLSHVVSQAGPLDLSTGTWIWHQDLHEPSFCHTILDELENLFVEVGAGLMDGMMMRTMSLLLTRMLASSPDEGVSKRVITLLRRVRRRTFNLAEELLYNLVKAPTNTERSGALWEMAATCRSTFSVDSVQTLSKLCDSAEDVDTLISCTFFLHTLPRPYMGNRHENLLSKRDDRLTFMLEETLRDVIFSDVSDYGIDSAISKTFTIHKASPYRWEQLQHPNSRWFVCNMRETKDEHSQVVHLNLLDGELKADGQQVGKLRYEMNDSIYQHAFRDKGFFVIPSNLPEMDFTTLATMTASQLKVHWAQRGESFVVRVQHNETKDVLELIPSGKLKKDLPPALVNDCIHWLNLSTRTIEIRPLERLWEESPDNWRIDCTSGRYRAYKSTETLVDIRSPTWRMLSKCFDCLNFEEWSNDILVTTSLVESPQSAHVLQMSATLLRYELSFFVNANGELESSDFKDMVYDENQCIDTLPGLKNILVLRQKAHLAEGLIPRRILIPSGFLSRDGDHQFKVVCERCQTPDQLYHSYNVDTELGCLTGNDSLRSTGYLAHLHATTSCYWPDPLTGRTGAQAALYLFRSAACRSIMKLKSLDISAVWSSSRYPEIKSALTELQRGYYWDRNVDSDDLERRVRYNLGYKSWLSSGSLNHQGIKSGDSAAYLPEEPGLPTPQVTFDQILSERTAPELPPRSILCYNSHKMSSEDTPELNQFFSSLLLTNKHKLRFQQEYIALLQNSTQFLRNEYHVTLGLMGNADMDALEKHHASCRATYMDALASVKESLGPTSDLYEEALSQFGHWPQVTANTLLRYLAPTSPCKLSRQWNKCLISLTLLLLDLQRARRLLLYALDGREEEFFKELENEVCDGWDPEEFPDWLLIQVQGNFLIRRAQTDTARAMMYPGSEKNTLMQVNMGDGKSSVIIPIVAAALADGKQLVRIIVPKALTAQMFELLVSRLGGLANRPIYHLPFSRSPEYKNGKVISLQIDDLQKLMSQCMAERGILLVQPEHVASLQLKSVEEQIHKRLLAADPLPRPHVWVYKHVKTALLEKMGSKGSLVGNMLQSLSRPPETRADYCGRRDDGNAYDAAHNAHKWVSLLKWIHSHVRDVLDESDEILRPRFQLVYTMGHQRHMDGYPDRWTITQQVLRLVKECADTLSSNHPSSMEYKRGPPGSFPHVRIMRTSDVGLCLIPMIVEHVMAGRLPSINIQDISDSALQGAMRTFISQEDALRIPGMVKRVEEYARRSDQSCLWNRLLLLRGLLTSNILMFALTERRWRVDYGLVAPSLSDESTDHLPIPTMLAVPYRAKDVPAPNTQFGHPDITIILTCLSYYYGGLSEKQLRSSFEILLDEDDPTTEYALWVTGYESDRAVLALIPTLDEINLRPSEQWDNLVFPLFSRNQATIDFYLSRVVFPKEAKEYPSKLSASSWDLAEERVKPITGFSGTNDGRWLLPMSIIQHELDHQRGTNGRVLAYLLRDENNSYRMAVDQNGALLSTFDFLQTVAEQKPEIHVLLDVGAQILDVSNEKVAKAWLGIVRNATGAIYFSEDDDLMVLMRNGAAVPLLSSSFSQHLDRCVVYLDHAHTRGTDIKLPKGSRAAVTLGPKLTKDSLVQGCMRMRKLGHGHSVMFFAPPEVDWSIRAVSGKKDPNTSITTADILCWAIHETWTDIQQQTPYWAQQGMNHKSRLEGWTGFCNNDLTSEQLSRVWLQPELKSLEELYAPCKNKNLASSLPELDPGISQRCKDLGILSLSGMQMEEEQEREVNRQREREREAELPPEAEAAEHSLHPDVVSFVKTGIMPPLHSSSAFCPVFTALKKSSAAAVEGDVWSPFILATVDFCNTIKPDSTKGTIDQYLRPVQWVLSSQRDPGQLLVLLSPFEASHLIPDIRESEYVHLHVYAPRTSKRMKPSDDLKLYTIPSLPSDWTPPWALIDQLNVFAGQLYLRDYPSYLRLCDFLEISTTELPIDGAIRRNMFDIPGSFEESEIMFSRSPLPSVMALLAIRTRGRPFAHTHMGKILYGQILSMKDFEEPRSIPPGHTTITSNEETSHNFASETMPSSASDMEYDPQNNPGSSGLPPSSKRNLETAEICGTDSEPPQKRLCSDR